MLLKALEQPAKNRGVVSNTDVTRFFRQNRQRVCRMGGLTARISEQACRKIKADVRAYLRDGDHFNADEVGPVKWHAKYCPDCRHFGEDLDG